jgi:hypothetical protein
MNGMERRLEWVREPKIRGKGWKENREGKR